MCAEGLDSLQLQWPSRSSRPSSMLGTAFYAAAGSTTAHSAAASEKQPKKFTLPSALIPSCRA